MKEDDEDKPRPKTSSYVVRNILVEFQNYLGFDDEMTEKEGKLVDSVLRSMRKLLAYLEKSE